MSDKINLAQAVKAYHVQGDEYGVIRFASSNVVARREGANELDEEFNAVSCKRIPAADKYAPDASVPTKALVEEFGWWQECGYCNHHVDNEVEDRVWDGDSVYCSAECNGRHINRLMDYEAEFAKSRQDEANAVIAAQEKFPGITNVRATHNYKGEIEVYFNFPGGEQRASWKAGSSSVYPAAHEVTLFMYFLSSIKNGEENK